MEATQRYFGQGLISATVCSFELRATSQTSHLRDAHINKSSLLEAEGVVLHIIRFMEDLSETVRWVW